MRKQEIIDKRNKNWEKKSRDMKWRERKYSERGGRVGNDQKVFD